MTRLRLPVLAGLAALAACAQPAQQRAAGPELPLQPAQSAADPARQAIISTSYVFGDTRRLRGRPADAARAAAQLEWMAATLPQDPRWIGTGPMVGPQLLEARTELRETLGISPAAPPAQVVSSLDQAARALDSGSPPGAATALAPVAPGGGEAVLARLAAMPQQPRVAAATRSAEEAMFSSGRSDPE